jgi:hypothetical protein
MEFQLLPPPSGQQVDMTNCPIMHHTSASNVQGQVLEDQHQQLSKPGSAALSSPALHPT